MKNTAKKAVSKEMRVKAEEVLTGLQYCPYGKFRLLIGHRTDSNEVEGGRCIIGSDGKLCLSEKERGKIWKDYVDRIMNEENDWDHNVEGDAVEGPVVCVLQALMEMKTGRAHGPLEVSLELIVASRGVGNQVLSEICKKVLDVFGMPAE